MKDDDEKEKGEAHIKIYIGTEVINKFLQKKSPETWVYGSVMSAWQIMP